MSKTEKVDAFCVACGTCCQKNKKPAPKNNKEKKQLDFRCRGCGAINLRDGTAIYDRKLPPEEGAPTPKDKAKPPKEEPQVKPSDAAPEVKEPERSIEDEESDDSLTIL